MNDPDHVHRALDAAFASRAESVAVSSEPPPFHEIAERGQQRTTRTLAAATIGVVAIGAAGLLAASSFGSDDPSQSAVGDALPAPSDEQYLDPATTVQFTTWACSGPIGVSDDGSISYYQSCEPVAAPADVPYPATTTLEQSSFCTGSPDPADATITNPLPCVEPSVVLETSTTLVEPPVPITTLPCTISGCRLVYAIQTGDYPLLVADAFCVTIDDLVAANGWSSINEFGFPGTVIQIPPASTPCPTDLTAITTTTTP